MKCSARCFAGASKLAGMGAGWLNNPANPLSYSSMGPLVAASLDVFAHASAPRGKPEFGLQSTIIGRKTVPVREEIVLRKPFGAAQAFRPRRRSGERSQAADRRADVGPLCDPAARHGRAAAAAPRRLHHRLARREAGAAVGRQLRPRRLCRLSDRVPRGDRRGERRAAAHARGLPAGGAGLCRDRADGRGQEPVAAEDADDDGRADRHARGADRDQHAGDAAAARLVREQCHRDRADDLSGRRAEGLSGLPAARRLHDHEPRRPPHQPLGDVQASRRGRRGKRRRDPRVSTRNIARSAT